MSEEVVLGAPILWLSILTPPLLAALAGALGFRSVWHVRLVAYASAALFSLPAAATLWYLYVSGHRALRDPLYVDLRSQGFGALGLAVDHFSAPVVIGVSLVTSLVSIYSIKYMEHRIAEMEKEGVHAPSLTAYYIMYLLFSSSMLGVAMSTNMIELYVFLELSLISSFLLIALYGYGDRFFVALLYFVWTHVSSMLILLGVLYFGLKAGSFDILDISSLSYVAAYSSVELKGLSTLIPILMTLGLLIKLAAFGVHVWLPYAHAEAPTPVSALLSPNMVGLAGYLIARLGFVLFGNIMTLLSTPLIVLALVSIVFGGLLAVRENDIKRLLAYSSVSQMGYILLGIAALSSYGLAGAMLHYLAHAVGKAILFMVAGVFIMELEGLRSVEKAGGLAKVYPVTSGLAVYGFMHLMGMPPAMGLWSKILIFFGLVETYLATPLALAAIAVAATFCFLATVFYVTTALSKIFFGETRGEWSVKEEFDEPKATILVLGVTGLLLFMLTVAIAGPLLEASAELLKAGGAP
ncbi:MAG: complex I subunit 5 family protein [Acidilobaceae archaeon]